MIRQRKGRLTVAGLALLCTSTAQGLESGPTSPTAPPVTAPAPGQAPTLPLELGRLQDEIKRIDDRLATEPTENRKVQLCGAQATLTRLSDDIAKAPLLEMTQQNFRAWRAATAELQARAQDMASVCAQPDLLMFPIEEKYDALKRQFTDLLRIRQ